MRPQRFNPSWSRYDEEDNLADDFDLPDANLVINNKFQEETLKGGVLDETTLKAFPELKPSKPSESVSTSTALFSPRSDISLDDFIEMGKPLQLNRKFMDDGSSNVSGSEYDDDIADLTAQLETKLKMQPKLRQHHSTLSFQTRPMDKIRSKKSMPVMFRDESGPDLPQGYTFSRMSLSSPIRNLFPKKEPSNLDIFREADTPRKHKHSNINLIKQSIDAHTPQVKKRMVYNPEKMVWEGNEGVLEKFKVSRPKLIKQDAPKKIVGNMMFDPDNLKWVSLVPEEDPFKDIVTKQLTRKASSMLRDPNAFQMSPETCAKWFQDEEKWAHKVRHWFVPYENEELDTEFMYEIRNMVMNSH